jgi:hypothetical protein
MWPCDECYNQHSITELLLGFEDRSIEEQLREINEQLKGLNSRIANYFMALMRAVADEAKHGPRLFTIESIGRRHKLSPKGLIAGRYRLQLWCEAENCQHPVFEEGLGVYDFDMQREWIGKVAPYANFVLGALQTVLPVAAPAVDAFFGKDTIENWEYSAELDLGEAVVGQLSEEIEVERSSAWPPGDTERSGLLAFHVLLNELDPNQERLGLKRVPTRTGDYRWLCQKHYEATLPKIPEKIE